MNIRVHLNHYSGVIELIPDGLMTPTSKFVEKVNEIDQEFWAKIIVPINYAIGEDDWFIRFTKTVSKGTEFFDDANAKNEDDYLSIRTIIASRIEDVKFKYYYKGKLS